MADTWKVQHKYSRKYMNRHLRNRIMRISLLQQVSNPSCCWCLQLLTSPRINWITSVYQRRLRREVCSWNVAACPWHHHDDFTHWYGFSTQIKWTRQESSRWLSDMCNFFVARSEHSTVGFAIMIITTRRKLLTANALGHKNSASKSEEHWPPAGPIIMMI